MHLLSGKMAEQKKIKIQFLLINNKTERRFPWIFSF